MEWAIGLMTHGDYSYISPHAAYAAIISEHKNSFRRSAVGSAIAKSCETSSKNGRPGIELNRKLKRRTSYAALVHTDIREQPTRYICAKQ